MDLATRQLVRDRVAGRGEYCRLRQEDEPFFRFHVEHVAKQHGGDDHSDNLALVCHHGNEHKGPNLSGIDPWTGKVVRLFHPRRQQWTRHFRYDGPLVIGRTRAGRATVRVPARNAPDRLELRTELIAEGSSSLAEQGFARLPNSLDTIPPIGSVIAKGWC